MISTSAAHENRCADTFKEQLLIFVRGIGGIDGRTFIEEGIDFNDILIIKNSDANAFFLLSKMMGKEGYIDPTDATTGMIRQGYYYWSDYSQSCIIVKSGTTLLPALSTPVLISRTNNSSSFT